MSNKLSTAELITALIITIGLFIGSLEIWDGARSADFTPVKPVCYDRYQVSHKAVLHCPIIEEKDDD